MPLCRAQRIPYAVQFIRLPKPTYTNMPESPSTHAEQCHAMALAAFERGDAVLAVQCFVDAIAKAPGVAVYHRNLGELCRRLGRLDEALLAGRRAVELEPRDADAHANLGLAWSDSQVWAEAVAAYRIALALNPVNGFVWNNLGVALVHSSQFLEAERAFLQAVQLNPAHAEAQINLAMRYRQQGKQQAAQQCLALAEQASPGLALTLGITT